MTDSPTRISLKAALDKWDDEMRVVGPTSLLMGDAQEIITALSKDNRKLREVYTKMSTLLHDLECRGVVLSEAEDYVWQCAEWSFTETDPAIRII